jgi:tRNA pseudouridine13 synthase
MAGPGQQRRALRLRPDAPAWRWLEDDGLDVGVALPVNAYATLVLTERADIESDAHA